VIGYLYLTIALTAGLVKGFSGKKVSRDVISLNDGFVVNTIRTIFCSLIGFIVAVLDVGFSGLYISLESIAICFASSFFMATFCISWLYAYKSEAYVFLSVFTMLGSVVTALLGWIFYGDQIKVVQIIGFILLFVAVYVVSLYNKNLKGKMTRRAALTLVIGGIGAALSDFMQKVFIKENLGAPCVFTFYTYALMIIPQLIALLIFSKGKKIPTNQILRDKRHISIFFIMSVALYVNVITKTLAVGYIPSTQMYPTLQGANLIASAVLASILFKEKITKKSVVGILIALASVVVINL
jgi:drug/metabolite transporter (DMT)-like permease